MNAKEARDIAENKHKTVFREQFDKILNDVKLNCKHGFFEINWYDSLNKDVEQELKKLGYTITKTPDGRNNYDIKISW